MVSKKRLHYGGFDGFHSPVVPKAPRSIRRNPHKKSSSGSEICAFELLAAVAGKLLQESEGSASSTGSEQKEQIGIPKENVKQESLEEDKVKPDLDHGCCAESQFVPETSNNLELKLEPPLKDSQHSDNDSGLEHASIVTTSDFFKEVDTNVKLEALVVNTPNKSEGDLCDVNMDTDIPKILEKETENLEDNRVNHCVLNKPYSSVHVPFYRGRNVKVGNNIRDDDENYSFSCNQYNTKMKAFRLQSRGGYRRMRKMLSSSKYWKSAPKLKDYEVSNTTRKNGSKKRKLFQHTSKPEYVEETSSESISNLPERHPSKRVKFSIKSFKVPELYLEMPETSTVGSLKRTVMEALTAILGGELHVGVLFQGEKVRDDNITLQQTGISLNSDTLGFMLEPTLPEPSESPIQKQPPTSPQSDNQKPLLSTDSPITDVCLSNSSVGVGPALETNQIEKSEEEVEIVAVDTVTNTCTDTNTKAIVPITEAVPVNQNKLSKRSELSQRRTRRPFSVSEVEALVEAVETLGTGRWRDVKIRAFDDANHRTYVDLKDKWKTLVHTASISPQQRRGEPVPQNLLDRVLGAHGFWSQHQSKQHVKVGTPVKVCLELEG